MGTEEKEEGRASKKNYLKFEITGEDRVGRGL